MTGSRENKIDLRALFICVSCCALIFTSFSCEPLRKKFVRKKKSVENTSEKFNPVLDPIDYPAVEHSAMERYKLHYSLWKVWYRDLITAIDEEGSDKRQKYLMDQMIVQMEEMDKWIVASKKSELSALISDLRKTEGALDDPAPMRNRSIFKSKIESNAKKLQDGFKPQELEELFKDQM